MNDLLTTVRDSIDDALRTAAVILASLATVVASSAAVLHP